jgi:hypothetical protein
MTKQTAAIIAGSSFVVTTGLMFFVCANAHIDFFPCTETIRDFAQAKLVTQEGTCSLMDQLNSGKFDPEEKSELTGVGWAMLLSFCMGIGVADSALLYVVLSKKATQ